MGTIIDWLKAARWHASALHALEMWLPWIPAYFAGRWFGPLAGAAAAVIAWYWSRKQTETRAEASPGHLIDAWRVGWFPWQWSSALQLDFVIPAAIAIAVCLVDWKAL